MEICHITEVKCILNVVSYKHMQYPVEPWPKVLAVSQIVCLAKFAASTVVVLIHIVFRLLCRVVRCILNNCKKLYWQKKRTLSQKPKFYWLTSFH